MAFFVIQGSEGRERNPLAPGVRFPATLSCQAGAVVWLQSPLWQWGGDTFVSLGCCHGRVRCPVDGAFRPPSSRGRQDSIQSYCDCFIRGFNLLTVGCSQLIVGTTSVKSVLIVRGHRPPSSNTGACYSPVAFLSPIQRT